MGRCFKPTKVKRNIRKKMREHNVICSIIDSKIGVDGYQKTYAHVDKYDKAEWNFGVNWFNEGLLLEDADEKHKINTNFIRGYEYAKRLDSIKKKNEDSGRAWFISGNKLEDAPPGLLNNEYFLKGYNDAKNSTKIRLLHS